MKKTILAATVLTVLSASALALVAYAAVSQVSAKDLQSILTLWFQRPYEHMFDTKGPAMMINNRHYGVYMAGIKGLVLYGGIATSVGKHINSPQSDFYDLTPIERLSGIRVFTRKSDNQAIFSHYNPAIIRWGYANLIPAPDERIYGQRCSDIYRRIFSRFARLMAESYLFLKSSGSFENEKRKYAVAMLDRNFDALDYLEHSFSGVLRAYDTTGSSRLTPAMAIGFWIRRGIDRTDADLWVGLKEALELYDREWLEDKMKVDSPALRAGDDARRDGNWWQQQSTVMKVCYMVGFFDGMELGNSFSYWKHLKTSPATAGKAVDSYAEYSSKYFSNVTSGQIVDGLDIFFQDYRNRRIFVHDGVWLVVNAIAGTPQDELDRMIENWRKNVK